MKMEKEEIFQTDVEREVETTDIVSHVSVLRERLAELQSATRQDPALCMLIKTIQSGWLEVCRKEVWSASLQLYFTFREELPIQNWLIFKAERIIIPVTGKTRVSEFYASSSQESHRTAWMFVKNTESHLFARSAHRFGEVSITVQTMTDISKELNQRTISESYNTRPTMAVCSTGSDGLHQHWLPCHSWLLLWFLWGWQTSRQGCRGSESQSSLYMTWHSRMSSLGPWPTISVK